MADMGDYIGKVTLKLIRRYPLTWLSNATDTFVRDTFNFDYPQVAPQPEINEYTDPRSVDMRDVVRDVRFWRLTVWANRAEAPILCFVYVVSLLWALLGPIWLLRSRRNSAWLADGIVTALALSTVSTFVAFCLVESFHNRYGIPHLGVMVICAGYAIEKLLIACQPGRSANPKSANPQPA